MQLQSVINARHFPIYFEGEEFFGVVIPTKLENQFFLSAIYIFLIGAGYVHPASSFSH
jgi:hypothetical protein